MTRTPRAILYAHDGLGLGHFRRMCRIAAALRQTDGRGRPSYDMTAGQGGPASCAESICAAAFAPLLLTGHNYAADVVPAGCEFIRLPLIPDGPLGETATGPEDWMVAPESAAILRREIIDATVRAYAPDVILVDHTPTGKGAEMLKPLKENRGANYFVYRGIAGAPDIERGTLAKAGAVALRDYYKRMLVVCDARICDVVAEHRLPAAIAEKITYCGYLAEDVRAETIARVRRERGLPTAMESCAAPWVVCSVGGGWNGASLVDACLRLANQLDGAYFDIVVGPRGQADIVADPPPADRVRLHASTNGLDLMHAACDLVICSGGYNSLVEAMAGRTPAIVVPAQTDPDDEQYLHARRLAEFYPVDLVPEIGALDTVVRRQIAELDMLRQRAGRTDLDLNGLAAVRRIINEDLHAGL
jgi:predicted glycosyltransferase